MQIATENVIRSLNVDTNAHQSVDSARLRENMLNVIRSARDHSFVDTIVNNLAALRTALHAPTHVKLNAVILNALLDVDKYAFFALSHVKTVVSIRDAGIFALSHATESPATSPVINV